MNSRRFILAAAPIAIALAFVLTLRAPAAPPAPREQLLPDSDTIPTLPEADTIDSRRRGILIPRRVKEILSYNKTMLA